jgi:hypothetical protein
MKSKKTKATFIALGILSLPFVVSAANPIPFVEPFVGTSDQGLVDSLISIINALLVLAAIAAVVYIIVSGVRYVASQGDERETEQAKRGLIYGIIGIILIILSAAIINFFVANIA